MRSTRCWKDELDPETLVFCGRSSNHEVLECITEAKKKNSIWAVVPDHDQNGFFNKFRANLHNDSFTSDIAYALSSGVLAHRWVIQSSLLSMKDFVSRFQGQMISEIDKGLSDRYLFIAGGLNTSTKPFGIGRKVRSKVRSQQ